MLLSSRYYTLLNLIVLSVVIYCGVNIFYTLAGSKLTDVTTDGITTEHFMKRAALEERQAFDHYVAAMNRGLFGPVPKSADKSEEFKTEDLEPTALNIELLGTVSGDRRNAVAVIQEGAKRTQSLYKEGDSIEDATIVKILRGKVVLRVGNNNQILKMEDKPRSSRSKQRKLPGGPPRSRPERAITLDRSMVTESLGNISEIMSQIRIRPHYKDGKADGLMLSHVKPNTIFTKMRLRNGDVVQKINGKPIGSPDDIMGFYEELKSGSSVSVEITRRGRNKTLTYNFK